MYTTAGAFGSLGPLEVERNSFSFPPPPQRPTAPPANSSQAFNMPFPPPDYALFPGPGMPVVIPVPYRWPGSTQGASLANVDNQATPPSLNRVVAKLELMERTLARLGETLERLHTRAGNLELRLGALEIDVQQRMDVCGVKLEGIKAGLVDFSTDVQSWLNPGDVGTEGGGANQERTKELRDESVSELDLRTPPLDYGGLDMLEYMNEHNVRFDLE